MTDKHLLLYSKLFCHYFMGDISAIFDPHNIAFGGNMRHVFFMQYMMSCVLLCVLQIIVAEEANTADKALQ